MIFIWKMRGRKVHSSALVLLLYDTCVLKPRNFALHSAVSFAKSSHKSWRLNSLPLRAQTAQKQDVLKCLFVEQIRVVSCRVIEGLNRNLRVRQFLTNSRTISRATPSSAILSNRRYKYTVFSYNLSCYVID